MFRIRSLSTSYGSQPKEREERAGVTISKVVPSGIDLGSDSCEGTLQAEAAFEALDFVLDAVLPSRHCGIQLVLFSISSFANERKQKVKRRKKKANVRSVISYSVQGKPMMRDVSRKW